MAALGYQQFLKTLPSPVLGYLPDHLQLNVRQPYKWMVQFYDQDKNVHYEVQRAGKRADGSRIGFELGLHFESRNKPLNQHMLLGFSRRLVEIHATLGDSISAEPWDRGWTKVYDIFPDAPLSEAYQAQLAARLADIIRCLHPMLLDLYDTPVNRTALYSF